MPFSEMPKLKTKLLQTQRAVFPNTSSSWLPQGSEVPQVCFQLPSLPFWAHSDCMFRAKQAGRFLHRDNHCWAHKLSIPSFMFLKWLIWTCASRDASLSVFNWIVAPDEREVQFSTSAWGNLIQIFLALILSVLDTSRLYTQLHKHC